MGEASPQLRPYEDSKSCEGAEVLHFFPSEMPPSPRRSRSPETFFLNLLGPVWGEDRLQVNRKGIQEVISLFSVFHKVLSGRCSGSKNGQGPTKSRSRLRLTPCKSCLLFCPGQLSCPSHHKQVTSCYCWALWLNMRVFHNLINSGIYESLNFWSPRLLNIPIIARPHSTTAHSHFSNPKPRSGTIVTIKLPLSSAWRWSSVNPPALACPGPGLTTSPHSQRDKLSSSWPQGAGSFVRLPR